MLRSVSIHTRKKSGRPPYPSWYVIAVALFVACTLVIASPPPQAGVYTCVIFPL